VKNDEPYLEEMETTWLQGTPTLRALVKQIVTSQPFTQRHGELEP
jgi:hypothetical protein